MDKKYYLINQKRLKRRLKQIDEIVTLIDPVLDYFPNKLAMDTFFDPEDFTFRSWILENGKKICVFKTQEW